jgi:hypothetical protein
MLGIGTLSPGANLHIAGVDTQTALLLQGSSKGIRIFPTTTFTAIEGVDNTGSGSYQPLYVGGANVTFTTSNNVKMHLTNAGDLFVGSDALSPLGTSRLYISANSNNNQETIMINANTGASSQALFRAVANTSLVGGVSFGQAYSSKNAFIYLWEPANMEFSTNAIIRMTIDRTGLVGVNTTVPTANLHVTGNTYITTALGVGTPASAVTGEIRAANNVTAYYSSDSRLKQNISLITNPLEKVKSIRGVEFDWTDDYIEQHGGEDGYFVRKHDVGVIAQELEIVLPEVVATRTDGMKAVKYDRIVALLIEAIKELEVKVAKLEGK